MIPVTFRDTWCDPTCPFLEPVEGMPDSLLATCKLKNVDLDWYDYWLAVCVEENVV